MLVSAQEVMETTEFTDNLVISVDDEVTDPMEATVIVEFLDDGNINFLLKNLILMLDGLEAPVGNIEVDGIPIVQEEGYQSFSFEGIINIADGDLDGYYVWLGPMLEDVPLDMTGNTNGERLYVSIDIDMVVNGEEQIIHVEFGEDLSASVQSIVASLTQGDGKAYDLSGRQVPSADLRGGIYIVNGKKVVK